MGSINFRLFRSFEWLSILYLRFAGMVRKISPLASWAGFLLILMAYEPSPALGQSSKVGPVKILKQVVDFKAYPIKNGKRVQRGEPGDTVQFVYKIHTDTNVPFDFRNAKVKLKILKFSETPPFDRPSLIHSTFSHITAYRLKANQGGRDPMNFNPTPDNNTQTVTYFLNTVKIDSVQQPADTLGFEFFYKTPSLPDSITCLRLSGGIAAEFIATNPLTNREQFFGDNVANFQVDTESDIRWDFQISKLAFQLKDTVDLTIEYSNYGNIRDQGTFIVRPILNATFRSCRILSVTAPPGVTVQVSNPVSCIIEIKDPQIPADSTILRTVTVRLAFDICSLFANLPRSRFEVSLFTFCDASTQRSGGETKFENVTAPLLNLLAVELSATPNPVKPGETIDYTITVNKLRSETIDSVLVTLKFFPTRSIATILTSNPPLESNSGDSVLTWRFRNFDTPTIVITLKAILRPDFYFAIAGVRNQICTGALFSSIAEAQAFGDCPDGLTADNIRSVPIRVEPLADLLRLSVDVADENGPGRILPGDVLRFVVRYANVDTFVSSGFFEVLNTLPSRQYVSAPFDISPQQAIYDPSKGTIRVSIPDLKALQSDSLVFRVRARDDTTFCSAHAIFDSARIDTLANLDCVIGNNAAQRSLTIDNPQTALTLKADILRADADHNEIVDLLIIYGSGASLIPIKNITVVDSLDAGLKLISSAPPVDSTSNGKLFWKNLPALQPGQTDTIRLRVQLVAMEPCKADTLLTAANIFSNPAVCAVPPATTDSIILRGTDDQIALSHTTLPSPATPLNVSNQDEIEYRLTIRNNSQIAAQNLTVTDTPPASGKFNVTFISPGGDANTIPGKIVWMIPQLAVGDSATVSFKGRVIDALYCAPDSLVNQFVFKGELECSRDSARIVHHLLMRPEIRQLRLLSFTYRDDNGNRLVAPNERVTLCLSFTGDTSFSNITFRHPLRNTNNLIGVVAQDTVLAAPDPGNRTSLAAGQTVEFCFSFQAPANITRDSLFVEGLVASNLNCGQKIGKFALPTRGAAILAHNLELRDDGGNGLVSEGEWITATVPLAHQPNSGFDADNVRLHLRIRIEQPGSAQIELPRYSLAAIDTLIPFLPKGSSVSWSARFRYPDLTPINQRICVTAYYTRSDFNAMRSEDIEKCINIVHDCFAKPRTFIPAVHMQTGGLKFKPDDDLKVFIVDVDGNKIWDGTTRQAWDGKTRDGRPAPPGTYIYVIEDQCKGTIVLLR
jgi:uncharacterized repeat protein (TIGR01451 family)